MAEEDDERMRRRMEAFDEGSDGQSDDESEVDDNEALARRAKMQLDGDESMDEQDEDDDDDAVEEVSNRRQGGGKPAAVTTKDDASQPLGERIAQRRAAGGRVVEAQHQKGPTENLTRRYSEKAAKIEKRATKNAPVEMSNKRVHRKGPLAVVLPPKKPKLIDPRFNEKCGELKDGKFRESYAWLDKHEETEIKTESLRLRREKRKGEAHVDAKAELDKVKQRRLERKRGERREAIVTAAKRDATSKIAQGKKPFFVKKSELKKRILEDQFAELKKTGKLNKFLVRKARKAKVTEAKSRPERRSAIGEEDD